MIQIYPHCGSLCGLFEILLQQTKTLKLNRNRISDLDVAYDPASHIQYLMMVETSHLNLTIKKRGF